MTDITITITPDERDDINLALREWISNLEEPLAKPRSALARRRRQKAKQLTALNDRIYMADLMAELEQRREL